MKIIRCRDAQGGLEYASLLADGSALALAGDPIRGVRPTGRTFRPIGLVAPIEPTAILGVGLNYRRHAAETGAAIPTNPILFFKGLNTVANPGDPIRIPRALASEEVDYECELAVVIGKSGRNIPRERALEHVAGYTCANDVSARDWQIRLGGGQWCRGKSFDTFTPLGPCLVTPDEIPDPNRLRLRTVLNGTRVQDWSTDDMIFDVPTLIAFLSGSTTLLAGTVILTGTPHGVGMAAKPPRWLRKGDRVAIEIDGIGTLENPVAEEVW